MSQEDRYCAFDKDRICNESCSAYDTEYWVSSMKLRWDLIEKKWVYLFLGVPEMVPFCFRLDKPLIPGAHSSGIDKRPDNKNDGGMHG